MEEPSQNSLDFDMMEYPAFADMLDVLSGSSPSSSSRPSTTSCSSSSSSKKSVLKTRPARMKRRPTAAADDPPAAENTTITSPYVDGKTSKRQRRSTRKSASSSSRLKRKRESRSLRTTNSRTQQYRKQLEVALRKGDEDRVRILLAQLAKDEEEEEREGQEVELRNGGSDGDGVVDRDSGSTVRPAREGEQSDTVNPSQLAPALSTPVSLPDKATVYVSLSGRRRRRTSFNGKEINVIDDPEDDTVPNSQVVDSEDEADDSPAVKRTRRTITRTRRNSPCSSPPLADTKYDLGSSPESYDQLGGASPSHDTQEVVTSNDNSPGRVSDTPLPLQHEKIVVVSSSPVANTPDTTAIETLREADETRRDSDTVTGLAGPTLDHHESAPTDTHQSTTASPSPSKSSIARPHTLPIPSPTSPVNTEAIEHAIASSPTIPTLAPDREPSTNNQATTPHPLDGQRVKQQMLAADDEDHEGDGDDGGGCGGGVPMEGGPIATGFTLAGSGAALKVDRLAMHKAERCVSTVDDTGNEIEDGQGKVGGGAEEEGAENIGSGLASADVEKRMVDGFVEDGVEEAPVEEDREEDEWVNDLLENFTQPSSAGSQSQGTVDTDFATLTSAATSATMPSSSASSSTDSSSSNCASASTVTVGTGFTTAGSGRAVTVSAVGLANARLQKAEDEGSHCADGSDCHENGTSTSNGGSTAAAPSLLSTGFASAGNGRAMAVSATALRSAKQRLEEYDSNSEVPPPLGAATASSFAPAPAFIPTSSATTIDTSCTTATSSTHTTPLAMTGFASAGKGLAFSVSAAAMALAKQNLEKVDADEVDGGSGGGSGDGVSSSLSTHVTPATVSTGFSTGRGQMTTVSALSFQTAQQRVLDDGDNEDSLASSDPNRNIDMNENSNSNSNNNMNGNLDSKSNIDRANRGINTNSNIIHGSNTYGNINTNSNAINAPRTPILQSPGILSTGFSTAGKGIAVTASAASFEQVRLRLRDDDDDPNYSPKATPTADHVSTTHSSPVSTGFAIAGSGRAVTVSAIGLQEARQNQDEEALLLNTSPPSTEFTTTKPTFSVATTTPTLASTGFSTAGKGKAVTVQAATLERHRKQQKEEEEAAIDEPDRDIGMTPQSPSPSSSLSAQPRAPHSVSFNKASPYSPAPSPTPTPATLPARTSSTAVTPRRQPSTHPTPTATPTPSSTTGKPRFRYPSRTPRLSSSLRRSQPATPSAESPSGPQQAGQFPTSLYATPSTAGGSQRKRTKFAYPSSSSVKSRSFQTPLRSLPPQSPSVHHNSSSTPLQPPSFSGPSTPVNSDNSNGRCSNSKFGDNGRCDHDDDNVGGYYDPKVGAKSRGATTPNPSRALHFPRSSADHSPPPRPSSSLSSSSMPNSPSSPSLPSGGKNRYGTPFRPPPRTPIRVPQTSSPQMASHMRSEQSRAEMRRSGVGTTSTPESTVPPESTLRSHFAGLRPFDEIPTAITTVGSPSVDAANAITFERAESFRFECWDDSYVSPSALPTAGVGVGVVEFEERLVSAPDIETKFVTTAWVSNHYALIVWKLASYFRAFPQARVPSSCKLVPSAVLAQLRHRYVREVERAHRSALRLIYEKDAPSSRHMVLCVTRIVSFGEDTPSSPDPSGSVNGSGSGSGSSGGSETKGDTPHGTGDPVYGGAVVELTDGWYKIHAVLDETLTVHVAMGRICEGLKIRLFGAVLSGSADGVSPLEATETTRLVLRANGTRRAPWHSQLGFQRTPAFLNSFHSVVPAGGIVPSMEFVVLRRYPILYMESIGSKDDGAFVRRVVRTQKEEDVVQRVHQDTLSAKLEEKTSELYLAQQNEEEQRRRRSGRGGTRKIDARHLRGVTDGISLFEMYRKSGMELMEFTSLLDGSQASSMHRHQQRCHDKKEQDVADKIQEMVANDESLTRRVTPFVRLEIVDAPPIPGRQPPSSSSSSSASSVPSLRCATLTIWRPSEEVLEMVNEGARLRAYALTPYVPRRDKPTADADPDSISTTVEIADVDDEGNEYQQQREAAPPTLKLSTSMSTKWICLSKNIIGGEISTTATASSSSSLSRRSADGVGSLSAYHHPLYVNRVVNPLSHLASLISPLKTKTSFDPYDDLQQQQQQQQQQAPIRSHRLEFDSVVVPLHVSPPVSELNRSGGTPFRQQTLFVMDESLTIVCIRWRGNSIDVMRPDARFAMPTPLHDETSAVAVNYHVRVVCVTNLRYSRLDEHLGIHVCGADENTTVGESTDRGRGASRFLTRRETVERWARSEEGKAEVMKAKSIVRRMLNGSLATGVRAEIETLRVMPQQTTAVAAAAPTPDAPTPAAPTPASPTPAAPTPAARTPAVGAVGSIPLLPSIPTATVSVDTAGSDLAVVGASPSHPVDSVDNTSNSTSSEEGSPFLADRDGTTGEGGVLKAPVATVAVTVVQASQPQREMKEVTLTEGLAERTPTSGDPSPARGHAAPDEDDVVDDVMKGGIQPDSEGDNCDDADDNANGDASPVNGGVSQAVPAGLSVVSEHHGDEEAEASKTVPVRAREVYDVGVEDGATCPTTHKRPPSRPVDDALGRGGVRVVVSAHPFADATILHRSDSGTPSPSSSPPSCSSSPTPQLAPRLHSPSTTVLGSLPLSVTTLVVLSDRPLPLAPRLIWTDHTLRSNGFRNDAIGAVQSVAFCVEVDDTTDSRWIALSAMSVVSLLCCLETTGGLAVPQLMRTLYRLFDVSSEDGCGASRCVAMHRMFREVSNDPLGNRLWDVLVCALSRSTIHDQGVDLGTHEEEERNREERGNTCREADGDMPTASSDVGVDEADNDGAVFPFRRAEWQTLLTDVSKCMTRDRWQMEIGRNYGRGGLIVATSLELETIDQVLECAHDRFGETGLGCEPTVKEGGGGGRGMISALDNLLAD